MVIFISYSVFCMFIALSEKLWCSDLSSISVSLCLFLTPYLFLYVCVLRDLVIRLARGVQFCIIIWSWWMSIWLTCISELFTFLTTSVWNLLSIIFFIIQVWLITVISSSLLKRGFTEEFRNWNIQFSRKKKFSLTWSWFLTWRLWNPPNFPKMLHLFNDKIFD